MYRKWLAAIAGVVWFLVVPPLAASAGDPVPLAGGGPWRLIFSDEFDEQALDLQRWTTCYWWNKDGCTNLGNAELQWYRPENISVDGGLLRLTAQRRTVKGHEGRLLDYTSGMVTTGRDYDELPRPSRMRFRYGHVEVKAKIPAGKGFWAAVWLLPETRQSRPEIDIMEVLGDSATKLRMHYHYIDRAGEKRSAGKDVKAPNLAADWHVYGVTWDKDLIAWYLDGREVWRYTDAATISGEDMYLLLNLAVGGEWPGPPTKKTKFPSDYLVDYVRVWQRSTR